MENTLLNGNAAKRAPHAEALPNPVLHPVHDHDNDEEKMAAIRYHFGKIMETLGLDLNDASLRDTPKRVAKMFVKELFTGLDQRNFPAITTFPNDYGYREMLVEKNISLYSCCEHHFLPIIGRAHVAYFPKDKVVGLSKLNRLVQYHARRPQVQERLTVQIAESLKEVLGTEDVAVHITADHLCVASRGVEDTHSATTTSHFGGRFQRTEERQAFLEAVR